jgi:hypothetical protein
MVATMGREAGPATWVVLVGAGRVALGRPLAPTPIANSHHLCPGVPAGGPHWMAVWAHRVGSDVGPNIREDCGGARRARPHATEHDAAGAPAPGASASPGVALQGRVALALPLAPGPGGEASAPHCAPPPARGQAQHPRIVASAERTRSAPRWARDARAARSSEPEARGAGAGARRPVGRSQRTAVCFSPCGHAHAQAGRRAGGPTRGLVRDHAMGQKARRAGGGLGRCGACKAWRPRRAL